MSSADPTAPHRTAPLALWRVARAFLQTLHMLFGDPGDVARQHTLTHKAHALMASWLRSAEAMLRRLLLIEASAYPKPNARPLLTPRRARTRKLMVFAPEEPHTWRVCFRCFEPKPRRPNRKAPGAAAAARLERLRLLGAEPGQPIYVARDERSLLTAPKPKRCLRIKRARAAKRGEPTSRQDHFWVHERDLKLTRFHGAWPLASRFEALIRVFNDPTAYARRLAKRLHATPHRVHELFRAPPETWDRVDGFSLAGRFSLHRWRRRSSA